MKYSSHALRNRLDQLRSSRTVMEWYWNKILFLTRPSLDQYQRYAEAGLGGASESARQNLAYLNELYDNNGASNSLTLASYLHSSLTNPHDNWVTLKDGIIRSGVEDDRADIDPEFLLTEEQALFRRRMSLQLLSDQMHVEWSGENFHQEIFPYYKNLVDLGTSVFSVNQVKFNNRDRLIFRSRSLFQTYFLEDAFGRPNHVWSLYNASASQLVQFFCKGKSEDEIKEILGERIYKAYKDFTDENFVYVHCVYPDYEISTTDKLSFQSCYFLYDISRFAVGQTIKQAKGKALINSQGRIETDVFLKEEIIKENPYIISRIRKDPESIYGTGFSMEAFPLLIQLQQIQRSLEIGAQKNVEPPLNIPTSRMDRQFSSRPNAHNPMDILGNRPVGVEPSLPPIDLVGGLEIKRDLQIQLDKIYMIDKIRIEPTRRNRTATEVEKRTGEEIKLLSPFIGSLENEFLYPLVNITLDLFRKFDIKIIKDALGHLDAHSWSLKYISDIATAQTERLAQKVMEWHGYSVLLGEKDRRVLNLTDWVKAGKLVRSSLNIPLQIMNSPQKFTEINSAQAEAEQEQARQEQMGDISKVAGAVKTLQESENIRQNREAPKDVRFE